MCFIFLQIFLWLFPWRLRRWILINFFGFKLSSGAKIGYSVLQARVIILGDGARIGHGNIIIRLNSLELNSNARVGHFNWISGGAASAVRQANAHTAGTFKLGEHSALTSWHRLDCTGGVQIGKFSTVAGWQSQFVTHGIDLLENQQSGAPIIIGDFTMVGTRCVILKGASLPNYSVLAAASLLNKNWQDTYTLYGGVPASPIKKLSHELGYFKRKTGHVS